MSDINYGVKLTGDATGITAAYREATRGQQAYEAQVARQQSLMEQLRDAHGEARKAILDEVTALQAGIEANRDLANVQQQAAASAGARVAGHEAEAAAIGKVATAAHEAMKFLASTEFVREMVHETIEAETASARLTVQLRATGYEAGLTKVEIDELADSLAQTTQFDDESIRKAASEFLLLGNIQGEVFTEGIKLAADYAAATGRTVPEAARTLGKALQSPAEGMGMLERQMGRLTPAQDAMVKGFIAVNDLAGAQAAILDIVRQKVGGAAEEINTNMTRATSTLTKGWNELLESIGRSEVVGAAASVGLGAATLALKALRDVVETFKIENFEKIAHLDFSITGVDQFEQAAARIKGENASKAQKDAQWQGSYNAQLEAQQKLVDQTEKKARQTAESEAAKLAEKQSAKRMQVQIQEEQEQQARDKKLQDDRTKLYADAEKSNFDSWAKYQLDREAEMNATATANANAAHAELQRQADDQRKISEEAQRQAKQVQEEDKRRADAIERELDSALMRGFERGDSIAQVFWTNMQNMAKTVILEPLIKPQTQVVAAAASEASKGIGGFISGLFGRGAAPGSAAPPQVAAGFDMSMVGFANGGVMPGAGPMPLRRYAGGGVADSPQLAMYGEGSRPEAFVPLPDGRSIPVTMNGGGGGGVTINAPFELSIDARSASPGTAQQIAQTMNQLMPGMLYEHRRKIAGLMDAQRRERGRG